MQTHYSDAVLVLHGGAGTILRENLTPEREEAYRESLVQAARAGYALLQRGGSAVDTVCETVRVLEDNSLFNAGRGAVFTNVGKIELDAAVMDGRTGDAGAVASVTTVRNPILLARRVMEQSPFVFLVGVGAEEFANEQGIAPENQAYFATPERWQQLVTQREREAVSGGMAAVSLSEDNKFGTVGAVARDLSGHLAAATSTGGMTNKRYGRVGDSPLIGAGTWADDATCAISATGHGEYFIRHAVAHDIAARMAYGGSSLREASDAVVMRRLRDAGGEGGVIALAADGSASLPFNTAGMYRAVVRADGAVEVGVYAGD